MQCVVIEVMGPKHGGRAKGGQAIIRVLTGLFQNLLFTYSKWLKMRDWIVLMLNLIDFVVRNQ